MKNETKKTVFVVDDDVDYILQLKTMIENMGFNVVTACGQKEAEDMLDGVNPDLIITDLMMENMDSGFILSHRMKRMFPAVPIIIVTALTSETGMSFNLENEGNKDWIKADLYLEKGLRADQLHREINKLLKI